MKSKKLYKEMKKGEVWKKGELWDVKNFRKYKSERTTCRFAKHKKKAQNNYNES